MVKHIVMFKLGGSAEQRAAASRRFKEAIEALPQVIERLHGVEVGINSNPGESWDVVLTALLPDMEAVKTYATHPAHVAAAAILAPCKEARACVDYMV